MKEEIIQSKEDVTEMISPNLRAYLKHPPTHEPQSPAPGEPRGPSKWPFTKTDGSVSCEPTDDILQSRGYSLMMAHFLTWQIH